jgi:tRNA-dihydrouridine synthase B
MDSAEQTQNNSDPVVSFRSMLSGGNPMTALAPMQAVSSLEFWQVMHRYGGPDLYFTEYFRVHSTSRLNKFILRSVDQNPTGKPVIAQMIGNDIPALVRTAKELEKHPIAGIDLNLGCPAPIVYKKCAGGGLLRDPSRTNRILGALRDAIEIPFTVKTRLGFENTDQYAELLEIFSQHALDLLTIHGRTVKQMYRSAVDYQAIRKAAETVPFPVLANGNVYSAEHAREVLNTTKSAGWMIGRGAIRNPWIFKQIRSMMKGEAIHFPIGKEVLDYVENLFETLIVEPYEEKPHVMRLKKYMNFIALGIESDGVFLNAIRRSKSKQEFLTVCRDHLDHTNPMPLEPFSIPVKPCDVLAGAHR